MDVSERLKFCRGIADARVREAFARVDREAFVTAGDRSAAHCDHPLPIGHGQTISQPSLVAMMTEWLRVEPGQRVLEVGTGSGFQAAILAELAGEVYSVETVGELAATARERLEKLGYTNIHLRHGDGAAGWPEAAPFDRIMVTAAAEALPPTLLEQCAPSGRILIPVGPEHGTQELLLFEKRGDDRPPARRRMGAVRFVPLVGG